MAFRCVGVGCLAGQGVADAEALCCHAEQVLSVFELLNCTDGTGRDTSGIALVAIARDDGFEVFAVSTTYRNERRTECAMIYSFYMVN